MIHRRSNSMPALPWLVALGAAGAALFACAGGARTTAQPGAEVAPSVTAVDRPQTTEPTMPLQAEVAPQFVSIDDPRISIQGRTAGNEVRMMGYPGVTIGFRFTGRTLGIKAAASSDKSRLGIILDGKFLKNVQLPKGDWAVPDTTPLLSDLGPGEHHVELVHQNETWLGVVALWGIELSSANMDTAPELVRSETTPRKKILFIGDSVTCGEALLRGPECKKNFEWWDPYNSYGMVLGRALNAEVNLVCFGGRGLIRDWQGRRDGLNARELYARSVPLEAAPAEVFAGCPLTPNDVFWDHDRYVPDVVVVSLGTNDFNLALGALPGQEEYVSAYVMLVKELLQHAPNASIMLTEGSIVSDQNDPKRPQKKVLRSYIEATIKRVGSPNVHFAPANYYPGDSCDPHPTTQQHAQMAKDLLPYVERVLKSK